VSGGLHAKGSNLGANAATGDLLLFLDPEVLLPKGFLAKALSEFKERSLDVASCQLEPIEEDWMPRFIFLRFFYDLFYNWPAQLLENVLPCASSLILTKRDIHEKLGGFDEGIRIAEDHDYARRAAKIAKVGILRFAKLPLFMRRCQKEGIVRTHLRYQLCNLFNLVLGEVRSNIFRYDFGQYKNDISENAENPGKPGFVIQLPWIIAYYILVLLGLVAWLVSLLILTPRILRRLASRLFSKPYSIGPVE